MASLHTCTSSTYPHSRFSFDLVSHCWEVTLPLTLTSILPLQFIVNFYCFRLKLIILVRVKLTFSSSFVVVIPLRATDEDSFSWFLFTFLFRWFCSRGAKFVSYIFRFCTRSHSILLQVDDFFPVILLALSLGINMIVLVLQFSYNHPVFLFPCFEPFASEVEVNCLRNWLSECLSSMSPSTIRIHSHFFWLLLSAFEPFLQILALIELLSSQMKQFAVISPSVCFQGFWRMYSELA